MKQDPAALDRLIRQAQICKRALQDAQKKSERQRNLGLEASPKRRQAAAQATRTAFEHVDTQAHELHCLAVELGIAQLEPERYGDKSIRWNGCDWAVHRRHPKP
jgi:hypothetical protein